MITYFYDKKGIVYMTDFGIEPLSEEEQQKPNKIQLEEEYEVEYKDGFYTELYVEDGILKHRYIEVPKTENDEIKKLHEKLKEQETEITANQEAIAQVFELVSNGGVADESDK